MTTGIETGSSSASDDVLGTTGLFLNVGAVICGAVWLGMVVGGLPGGSANLTGVATLGLFGAGWACCAADRPRH